MQGSLIRILMRSPNSRDRIVWLRPLIQTLMSTQRLNGHHFGLLSVLPRRLSYKGVAVPVPRIADIFNPILISL